MRYRGTLLAPDYATTLRVTTVLVSVLPNSRIVVPDCAFMSATGTFILHKTGVMFISVHPSAVGVGRGLVRTTVASGAGTVIPIRCTNITYRVSAVVRVTSHRGLCMVRSTTRKVVSACGNETLNAVKRLTTFDFRRAGGCASNNRNNLLVVGSGRFMGGTRVVQRGNAGHDRFVRNVMSGCA